MIKVITFETELYKKRNYCEEIIELEEFTEDSTIQYLIDEVDEEGFTIEYVKQHYSVSVNENVISLFSEEDIKTFVKLSEF